MDRNDTQKLFTLLKSFFPNSKKATDRNIQLAWELALEPYAYEDIKSAAVMCVREKNFFPDVTDLTSKCLPVSEPVQRSDGRTDVMSNEWLWDAWKEFCRKLDAAGIPRQAEALICGQGCEAWERSRLEWEQRVLDAGIDSDWIGVALSRERRAVAAI